MIFIVTIHLLNFIAKKVPTLSNKKAEMQNDCNYIILNKLKIRKERYKKNYLIFYWGKNSINHRKNSIRNGYEIPTKDTPREIEEIEKLMKEKTIHIK